MAEPQAAVAIVHARGTEESILLIRRAERHEDPWSGHWSLPGGRRDPQDPDLVHTALRELEEECGIRLGREQLEAALPPMEARRPAPPYLLVAPFVFSIPAELAAIVDPREAVQARWVPLSTLRDPARHCLQCAPGTPESMLFPGIDLEGVPLWGFTYRLITEWLTLVPRERPEQAGFAAANRAVQFLLERGLTLARGWAPDSRIAVVRGKIPVADVLAHFCSPGLQIPPVNLFEVRPNQIRIIGLALEEYLIEAID